jgi:hypothetical protein
MPVLLATAALIGCGETEQDRERRAFDRYKRQVESACRATLAKISERGAPADLQALQRLAPQAILDAQELVRSIRDVDVPKGSERRVEPFLADLAAAGEDLNRMEAGVVGAPAEQIEDVTGAFHVSLVDVDFSGREAGIRCIGPGEIKAYDDAAEGPLFVERLLRFQRFARRKLAGVPLIPASTSTASVRPLYETVQEVRGRYGLLDVPSYAEKPAEAYGDVLFDLEQAYYVVLYKRGQGGTPSATKLRRKIARLAGREPRALRALIRALRTGLPSPDDPTAEGATPS